jgi:hypothetical protein
MIFRAAPLLGLAAAANHYCEFNVPSGDKVVRFEGKMNVPIKPATEPDNVLFLWPGLNPYSGQGGMMQPVLTYGEDYGQGAHKWGIANWFTNCGYDSGYCHDSYQSVAEGETLSWSMQFVGTETNGSQKWNMNWSAYNSGQSSTFPVVREEHDPATFWATEAEFYLDSSDPANYDKLPQSPFHTWDMRAVTASGAELDLVWTTHGDTPGDVRVNCSWTDGDGGHRGTQLSMPNGGCPYGFSRAYDYGCNSYCGCTNADGTRKVSCDYCCQDTGSACHRARGPVGSDSALGRNSVDTSAKPINALPRAGWLAQSTLNRAMNMWLTRSQGEAVVTLADAPLKPGAALSTIKNHTTLSLALHPDKQTHELPLTLTTPTSLTSRLPPTINSSAAMLEGKSVGKDGEQFWFSAPNVVKPNDWIWLDQVERNRLSVTLRGVECTVGSDTAHTVAVTRFDGENIGGIPISLFDATGAAAGNVTSSKAAGIAMLQLTTGEPHFASISYQSGAVLHYATTMMIIECTDPPGLRRV